jgi:hypothetical protein
MAAAKLAAPSESPSERRTACLNASARHGNGACLDTILPRRWYAMLQLSIHDDESHQRNDHKHDLERIVQPNERWSVWHKANARMARCRLRQGSNGLRQQPSRPKQRRPPARPGCDVEEGVGPSRPAQTEDTARITDANNHTNEQTNKPASGALVTTPVARRRMPSHAVARRRMPSLSPQSTSLPTASRRSSHRTPRHRANRTC